MNKFIFGLLFFLPVQLYAQNVDINLLRKINIDRNQHLDGTFKAITNTANAIDFAVPIVVFGTGFLNHDEQLKSDGLTIAASLFTTSVVTFSLKYVVNRSRPYVTYPDIQKLSDGGSGSFPSGHTSGAFSTATSLSLAFPKWYVIVPAYSWATAVAYSRMDLGVHYPSDVLAGAVVGAGCAFLCHKGQQWINNRKKKAQVPATSNNF
ncbi:MAG: phosphatase PAP2 family protein [Bacteroidota bacterium]|nr:phosphatase PAP2 family protein [Bacteroidota bacterium]